MSRLIDADALIKYCDKNWIPLNVDAVNAQPTADVRPNKKARLIVKAEGLTHYYICDQCGAAIDPDDNYCRKCGAEIGG